MSRDVEVPALPGSPIQPCGDKVRAKKKPCSSEYRSDRAFTAWSSLTRRELGSTPSNVQERFSSVNRFHRSEPLFFDPGAAEKSTITEYNGVRVLPFVMFFW
jgi:hypothetical protein